MLLRRFKHSHGAHVMTQSLRPPSSSHIEPLSITFSPFWLQAAVLCLYHRTLPLEPVLLSRLCSSKTSALDSKCKVVCRRS